MIARKKYEERAHIVQKETKAREAKELKSIDEFLRCVAHGEQDKAEEMLKELPSLAFVQFAELEDKGTGHGKYFSLVPLIKALNTYSQCCGGWCNAGSWDKMEAHLIPLCRDFFAFFS